jgi:uncharacterized protein YwgA
VENYLLVAGLIEAHPNQEVQGRARLQKTVRLLQRIGMGTDYTFSIHSSGLYSEELQSDITTIERVGLGTEESVVLEGNTQQSVLRARPEARNAQIDRFRCFVQTMASTDLDVLELAATYDLFREMGSNHTDALRRLRAKKGAKCDGEGVERAISLLTFLGLSTSAQVRHAAQ